MKTSVYSIFLVCLLFSGCSVFDTSENTPKECNFIPFKYYHGEKDTVGEMSPDYVLIGSDSVHSDQEIRNFVAQESSLDQDYEFVTRQYQNYANKQTVVKFKKSLSCESITAKMKRYERSPVVDYVHFTMQTDNCTNLIWEKIGDKCVNSYSSLFYVKIPNPNDTTALYQTAEETNTNVIKRDSFMENWFTLTADKNSTGDAFQMANYFYESGKFEATEPDIIKIPVE